MFFIAALVVMAQVDGGMSADAESSPDASSSVAGSIDAGAEWSLPPMIPFGPDPDEVDAGVAVVAPPTAPPHEPKLFDAAARLSLIVDRMQLSDGALVPLLNANVLAERKFGRWSVGTDVLVNVMTEDIALRDQGTNFWAGFRPGSSATNFVKLSIHPLGAQRLRIGEPPVSFGGDLVEPNVVGGTASGLGVVTQTRPATTARLDARFGRFAGYGWVQTTVRANPEAKEDQRQFSAAVGLRALNLFGVDVGGDIVRAPHGWTPPTFTASGSSVPGSATSFEAYRLFVAREVIAPPVDFQWQARNPERHLVFFADDELTSGVHFGGNVEASLLGQDLITSASETPGAPPPIIERVYVTVFGGRVSAQFARLRVHLGVLSRPTEYFLLESAPEWNYTLPFAEVRQDERSARLTVEWNFGPNLPRVGVGAGWIQPAARKLAARSAFGVTVPAVWLKYKDVGVVEQTPSQPDPITELRGTMTWRIHEFANVACELKYQNDPTRTQLKLVTGGPFAPGGFRWESEDKQQVYASLILQVRL